MTKDVLGLIHLYLDLNNYYKLKDELHLSVQYYCQNVEICTPKDINQIEWASSKGYLEVAEYLHEIGKDCTTKAMDILK